MSVSAGAMGIFPWPPLFGSATGNAAEYYLSPASGSAYSFTAQNVTLRAFDTTPKAVYTKYEDGWVMGTESSGYGADERRVR